MTRAVFVTDTARSHLGTIAAVLHLPEDHRERVRHSLTRLAEFPDVGTLLPEPRAAQPLRFIVGPWRWMLLIYRVEEASGHVTVIAIEDARMSTSVTTQSR